MLEKTGFVSYILIVWDFIHFAKGRGIPVGPGRGSAAGSLVAYVLGITDIDPLQFGLIFERFLNPDRVSPPDIDVDFCEARRGEVLEYVRQKYGERRVSQIITFGKLKAKSVVRDVGRVMGLSYRDADRIAKMIPNELNITLASAAEKNPELKRAIETEPETRQLLEYAKILEGLSRNAGVHAAGVVIADRDLSDYIPLCRDAKGNDVDQPVSDGAAERSRTAEDGFPRLENADRDRGHGQFDSQPRAGFFTQKIFRSTTQPRSTSTTAAKRSAFSKWNQAE